MWHHIRFCFLFYTFPFFLSFFFFLYWVQIAFIVPQRGAELDHKEGWALKNWCFQIVLGRFLTVPWATEGIKPINPKRNQPWIFIGRIDAEIVAPVLWQLMLRTNLLEKTLMLRKTESRRRGWQRIKWFDSITNSMDMSLNKLRDTVKDRATWSTTVELLRAGRDLLSEQ